SSRSPVRRCGHRWSWLTRGYLEEEDWSGGRAARTAPQRFLWIRSYTWLDGLLLAGGEGVATHSFAEFFALLRAHLLPPLYHAVLHALLPLIAMAGVTMEAAEENSAKDDKAKALPEGDPGPPKNLGQQRVPQFHRDEAEHGGCDEYEENDF